MRTPMEATFTLTRRDLFAFSLGHALRRKVLWAVIVIIPTLFTIAWARDHDWNLLNATQYWLCALILSALLYWSIIVASIFIRIRTKGFRAMLRPNHITIAEDSIEAETDHGRAEIKWAGIQKVRAGKTRLLIYTSPLNAFVIPRRAFDSDEEFREFSRQSQAYYQAAKAGS